jgi:pimeloyl-ACP methyl ester carboxylesterase
VTTHTTYGTGYSTAAPTEAQVLRTHHNFKADGTKIGIIACHSATARATAAFPNPTISNVYPKIQAWLAECGWPVLTADLSGDPCGNDTGTARVEEARVYLQSKGAKSGKVILLGWSEGGMIATNYTRVYPNNVAAMVLLQPGSDITDVVTNNRGGFAALLNAAYSGGWSEATYGATHNPVDIAPLLTAIPSWVGYATDDTVVLPSTVATLASGLQASAVYTNTGNHGDGFLSHLVDADGSVGMISRWLAAQGL